MPGRSGAFLSAAILAATLGAAGPAAHAGPLWSSDRSSGGALLFASPTGPPRAAGPHVRVPDEDACVAAILAAEREVGLPDHLLLAIGFTEAGRSVEGRPVIWPWTVNAEGEGRFFPTRGEAIGHVRALLSRGVRSIDVGCLQVNLRWHPDAFPDLESAFDPGANAGYAARFLAGLRDGHGGLEAAVGRYHSSQSEFQDRYRARVESNRRWVAQALARLEAPPSPTSGPSAADPFAWSRAERGRLAFVASLFANAPARPLLPDHR